MQRKIMFHLSDPTCGIQAIKFIDLNSGKMGVAMKMMEMRVVEKGKFNVFLIERFFKGGRVKGLAHQFFECGIDGGILVLEDLNIGIEGDKI
jgi:hypothetical protein